MSAPWHFPEPTPTTHHGTRNWYRSQARRQALDQKWAVRNAANATAAAAAVPTTGTDAIPVSDDAAGVEVTATTSKAPPATPPVEAKCETTTSAETSASDDHTLGTSAEVVESVEQTMGRLANADRNHLTATVFWICDLDHDGYLSKSEMLAYARHIGFEDTEEEWTHEYIQLCNEFKVPHEIGINRETFCKMINDQSDTGCWCTDKELRTFLEFLGKLSAESNASSSSTLDSSGTVRCGMPRVGVDDVKIEKPSRGVAGATRGSAAVAAPPGTSSVVETTGGVCVVATTDERKMEDETQPQPLSRDRTPRRSRRSPSSTSTSSSPPVAPPPSPTATVDPSYVAQVWNTIAEHLDSN